MDIQAIKEANPIEDVIQESGQRLRGRGRYLRGQEHDSLVVDVDKQYYMWNSKGQDHAGDVINWLENELGMDFRQAVEHLCRRAGMPTEWSEEDTAKWKATRIKHDALTVIAGYLQGQLANSAEATAWAEGRGWTAETLKESGVGFWDGNRKAVIDHLKLHQVDINLKVVQAALQMPRDHFVYTHWQGAKCVYLSSRTIRPGDKKEMYKNGYLPHYNLKESLAGERRPYFNHKYRSRSEHVVVVEGQADALTLGQWNVAAVALAGLADSAGLARDLQRHDVLYLALDADAAGMKSQMKLAEALGPMTRIVRWPEHDANDWLQAGGTAKDCEKLMGRAPIYAIWLARRAARVTEPVKRDKAKRSALQVASKLSQADLGMYRDHLLDRDHLNMTVGAFNVATKALQKKAKATQTRTKDSPPPSKSRDDDVITRSVLLREGADHEGHAQCTQALYPNQFAYVPQWDWLAYDGKRWVQDGALAVVERAITDTLRRRQAVAKETEYDDLAKAAGASHPNVAGTRLQLQSLVTVTTEEFDDHPDLLNVANGVLGLRSGELLAHDPSQRFTYCLDVPYAPDEGDDMPWLSWLYQAIAVENDTTETENVVNWLQEVCGYTLTGYTREDVFFYLFGPTRSGKGTFLNTMLGLMGKPLAAGVDITSFTSERTGDTNNFDLAPLKAARMVAASESKAYKRLNEEKIKQMSGEDMIRCAFKNQTHFEYYPQFKIFMASNWPLNMNADDDAAWGRARVIHFPYSHLGKEDRTLKERLQSPDSLTGILAWAVEGAMRWYERGGLVTPQSVMKLTEEQRGTQDLVAIWMDECCDIADPYDSELFTPTDMLIKSYRQWCKDNGVRAKGVAAFKTSLGAKGFSPPPGSGKQRHPNYKNPRHGFVGLQLVGDETQKELDF